MPIFFIFRGNFCSEGYSLNVCVPSQNLYFEIPSEIEVGGEAFEL